jgi:hypothetical protein
VDLVNDRMEEGALVFDERYFEIAVLVGDREVAERVADRVKEGSERLKLPLWGDPMMRAALSLLDGRLEEADAWVQRVMGHRGALTFAGPTLAALAIERCQCEAFVPVLEAQVDQTGDAGWSAALALFLIESGRPDEARPRLEAALRSAVPNLGWRVTMAVLAEAASILGDAKVAAAVREELEPLRGWMVMATGLCLGAVERPLGMCARTTGDLDAAVALLDEAVTRNHSFGTALWAAHSEVDLAMTLLLRRAAGDEQRAAHLLEAAASTADRLGLVRVARRAEAALGGGRLRPSSEPAGGGGSGGLVG